MVSQDDSKGEMTIRNKAGQVVTRTYKEISEGKIQIEEPSDAPVTTEEK